MIRVLMAAGIVVFFSLLVVLASDWLLKRKKKKPIINLEPLHDAPDFLGEFKVPIEEDVVELEDSEATKRARDRFGMLG